MCRKTMHAGVVAVGALALSLMWLFWGLGLQAAGYPVWLVAIFAVLFAAFLLLSITMGLAAMSTPRPAEKPAPPTDQEETGF